MVHPLAAHRAASVRDVGEAAAVKGRERENIRQVTKEGYEGASDTESEEEDEDENEKKGNHAKKHKKSE